MLASLVLLTGCVRLKKQIPTDKPVLSEIKSSVSSERVFPSCSVDFVACPLSEFCRFVSYRYNIPLSCDKSHNEDVVSLHFEAVSLYDVLNFVARACGLDIIPIGEGFYLGTPSDNDRIVESGYVYGYDSQFLQTTLVTLLPGCSVSVSPDGLCVVSCLPSGRSRVRSVLDNFGSGRGIYSVKLVWVSSWFDCDLLDGSLSVISDTTQLLRDWYWRSSFFGSFKLRLGGQVVKSDVYNRHDMVLLSGESSKVFVGSRVPIPRHTITDYGVNSVSGYDNIDVGDTLQLTCVGADDGTCMVSISYESGRISGYVEGYPRTDIENYNTSVRLPFGSVYCLASYDIDDSAFGFMRFFRQKRKRYLLLSVEQLLSKDSKGN